MTGKCVDRPLLSRAAPTLPPSPPYSGARTSFRLLAVVVALRPAVIVTLLGDRHFLRWQLDSLLGGVQAWPVLVQLVAAVCSHPEAPVRSQSIPHRCACRSRSVAGPVPLVGLVRVVAPIPPGVSSSVQDTPR